MMTKLLALRSKGLAVLEKLRPIAPTLARITLGIVFINSGYRELNDIQGVIDYFKELGIPFPELQAPMSASTQLVCGVLLLTGTFTRLAAIPLAVIMTVAIITAKKDQLDTLVLLFGMSEYLYIVLCSYLVLEGPGPLAVDRLLAKKLVA